MVKETRLKNLFIHKFYFCLWWCTLVFRFSRLTKNAPPSGKISCYSTFQFKVDLVKTELKFWIKPWPEVFVFLYDYIVLTSTLQREIQTWNKGSTSLLEECHQFNNQKIWILHGNKSFIDKSRVHFCHLYWLFQQNYSPSEVLHMSCPVHWRCSSNNHKQLSAIP